MEENKSLLENFESELENSYERASKGQRFLNYLLDLIFMVLLASVVMLVLGVVFSYVSPDSYYRIEKGMDEMNNYIFQIILTIIYYPIVEGLTGRSLAKFITGTKVIDESGHKPKFTIILKRTLCRLIPLNHFSFLNEEASGWHDSLSNTMVVKVKKD